MIAKVCSDKNKPNGQYRVHPDKDSVMDFVKDLPIRKVIIFLNLTLWSASIGHLLCGCCLEIIICLKPSQ